MLLAGEPPPARCIVQVIARASEAYGRMILGSGLFQADAHPGNILVMKRGRVGLIDYGQSKQLSCQDRLLFARLLVAMHTCVAFSWAACASRVLKIVVAR